MTQWHDNTGQYGSIEEVQKAASQKITNKGKDKSYEQTLAFVQALPKGFHFFNYPLVIEEVCATLSLKGAYANNGYFLEK